MAVRRGLIGGWSRLLGIGALSPQWCAGCESFGYRREVRVEGEEIEVREVGRIWGLEALVRSGDLEACGNVGLVVAF